MLSSGLCGHRCLLSDVPRQVLATAAVTAESVVISLSQLANVPEAFFWLTTRTLFLSWHPWLAADAVMHARPTPAPPRAQTLCMLPKDATLYT